MTFTALIAVCALFALLFFFTAIRRLRRRRVLGGMAHGAASLIFLLAAVCAVLVGTNLRSYQRLAYEQPAGELQLTKTGDRQFDAVLSYPDGQRDSFLLRGDEWQVDARVLKWHAFANLLDSMPLTACNALAAAIHAWRKSARCRVPFTICMHRAASIHGNWCTDIARGCRGWMRYTGAPRSCPWRTVLFMKSRYRRAVSWRGPSIRLRVKPSAAGTRDPLEALDNP